MTASGASGPSSSSCLLLDHLLFTLFIALLDAGASSKAMLDHPSIHPSSPVELLELLLELLLQMLLELLLELLLLLLLFSLPRTW